jgi:hypothetical protein|nr:MAG TPA: hypothetical protein [Caudoviricetes sp.]
MSKTLEKLIVRAYELGESNLNGRMMEYGYKRELRSKWAFVYDKQAEILTMKHWGTTILTYDFTTDTIIEAYGQSKSDADAINWFGRTQNAIVKASYRPSVDNFLVTGHFYGDLETKKVN